MRGSIKGLPTGLAYRFHRPYELITRYPNATWHGPDSRQYDVVASRAEHIAQPSVGPARAERDLGEGDHEDK